MYVKRQCFYLILKWYGLILLLYQKEHFLISANNSLIVSTVVNGFMTDRRRYLTPFIFAVVM